MLNPTATGMGTFRVPRTRLRAETGDGGQGAASDTCPTEGPAGATWVASRVWCKWLGVGLRWG